MNKKFEISIILFCFIISIAFIYSMVRDLNQFGRKIKDIEYSNDAIRARIEKIEDKKTENIPYFFIYKNSRVIGDDYKVGNIALIDGKLVHYDFMQYPQKVEYNTGDYFTISLEKEESVECLGQGKSIMFDYKKEEE